MTKSELIELIARNQKHLPAKDVELAVKHLLDLMSDALARGERIEIRGFGSFRTRQRAGRVGRNPKSAEKVDVPPKTIAFFKPSMEVLRLINPQESHDGRQD